MPSVRLSSLAVAVTLLGAPVALAGCSSTDAPASVSSGAAAAEAPADGSHLDPGAFAAAAKRPGTMILDVRTPAEFASGHLPGAVNVDWDSGSFPEQVAAYDKSRPYALYCHSGRRSGLALEAMQAAGFTAAYDLAGGMTAWTAANGETTTS